VREEVKVHMVLKVYLEPKVLKVEVEDRVHKEHKERQVP
jgi:hypothetical protein